VSGSSGGSGSSSAKRSRSAALLALSALSALAALAALSAVVAAAPATAASSDAPPPNVQSPITAHERDLRLSATAATPPATDPTPLLTFAASKRFPPLFDSRAQLAQKKRLDAVTFELKKDPPPEENCAQTLGAKRFATLFDDLASAYVNMGEEAKAADAFARAIGCNPRAAFLHAQLAASLLDVGRYSEARAEIQRQMSLGRSSFTIYNLMTQLDFIDSRWPEAVVNAKLAATEAPDDEQATYWQCFLWIAQKHTGSQEPALVNRRVPPGWPAPILQSLQGKITEAQLVEAVKAEHTERRQQEILTEALFYTGEQRLVANRPDEAARYFTATVELQVQYFIEHHLAVAELEKLRHPGDSL
jgi:lipoprotein NlpI